MNNWDFRCIECHQRLRIARHGICSRCFNRLEITPYCGCCGALLVDNHHHCGECLKNEPKWHRMVLASRYSMPMTKWIHQFKFQGQYWLDRPLARLLLLAIKNAQREHGLILPEVILPVPLYWLRYWKRGFNQAELLAIYLAKWLNIPIDTQSLKRVHNTCSQRELRAVQRRHNLKDAFRYQPIFPYQRIAIIDDVVTTGSTLNAICSELLKQGAKEIQVWTLARA
ncbi:phosphoribosyltransferase family protein [Actinobacillus genomosp. 1]|uniref:phosphoribosyltransferase family protein n=1 Tax=Actinobacillus genomosp. 1 TaxID=254839 RepID=UPI002441F4FD|nr:phosphoribosyltransferase family protein [Actinobacillus genomosp. 1]WGE91324.1 phosphoribosyltransferase family protein [Actinobacillus genomosp. 1]